MQLSDRLLAQELRQLDQVFAMSKTLRKNYLEETTAKQLLKQEIQSMHLSMRNILDTLDQIQNTL